MLDNHDEKLANRAAYCLSRGDAIVLCGWLAG